MLYCVCDLDARPGLGHERKREEGKWKRLKRNELGGERDTPYCPSLSVPKLGLVGKWVKGQMCSIITQLRGPPFCQFSTQAHVILLLPVIWIIHPFKYHFAFIYYICSVSTTLFLIFYFILYKKKKIQYSLNLFLPFIYFVTK